MTPSELADILKRRGCQSVCYFHTDHFEPWSITIDEPSARAVDRMSAMARSSRYARRLSLFYNVFIPYRLASEGPIGAEDERVAGDEVVFHARTPQQERLAQSAIRPLVRLDGHEMHLHVHHEYWTCNASHFDQTTAHWVNGNSTPEADRARLELNLKMCKAAIAREIGTPFERWAFIHGNWALNGSDPLICGVSDEMAILMRQGAFGDFTFPAGRSYCDPGLEAPFTCLPIDKLRAYDAPEAAARPVGPRSGAFRPGRFFVWNSKIKAAQSSLDYYSEANRKRFREPEHVVVSWLRDSVCLGGRLFIKTHAHSMKPEYRLAEPDAVIPHCHPDVVAIFDCLSRACDQAKVPLEFATVNEVVASLEQLDGTMTGATSASDIPGPNPSQSPSECLFELHREWMTTEGTKSPADKFYRAKIARERPLEIYETHLAAELARRFRPDRTRIVEIGVGWGGFACLLAEAGFDVLGFEGNRRRHDACEWHFRQLARRFPELRGRLQLAPLGLFPQISVERALADGRTTLCIGTDLVNSHSAALQDEILREAGHCSNLLIDLGRFGIARDSQAERNALFRTITSAGFMPLERLHFGAPNEYWLFASSGRSGMAPSGTARPRATQE